MAMNTRQSRIILPALVVVSAGAFSQAAPAGLDATQAAVEATTKAAASGVFNFDGTLQLMPPPQKPTSWWEWLRFAGGGR
jgi:hypothetical protein